MQYNEALDLLQQSKRVRRASWPRETIRAGTKVAGSDGDYVIAKTYELVWHLFMMDGFIGEPFWQAGIVNGWGYQVGGAADDDPIRDGMCYTPTHEDTVATDWEEHPWSST